MATISEINSGSGYRGEAALGGALGTGITLDTSPIQRLATFTYYRDRDMWEQQIKEDAVAAQQIANIAAFDINSPLKPYSDDLKKELNEIQTFVRENPDALVYSRNPGKFQELNERINRFSNKRKGATVNDTLYNAAKSKIELIPNKNDRDAQLELLDLNVNDLFKSGLDDAYRTQMKVSPELKAKDYEIPTIPLTEDFTITRNPNDTEITGLKYADLDRLLPMASSVYFGLGRGLDENSAEFKAMSEDEKKRARVEARITDRTRANLDNIANSVNGLIQQSKASNPDIKVMDIPDEMLNKNGSIGGVVSLAKDFNATVDKINAASGKKYSHINLDDGVNPEELILLQTYGQNKESFLSEIKPTVQQTDNAIQQEQMRNQKALGWANLNWDKEKFALSLKGPEQTVSAAVVFAENLVSDLASLGSYNGANGSKILTADDLRKATADQLKWLGSELPPQRNESGAVVQSGGVNPLTLKGDEFLEITKDGKLIVMKGAKFNNDKTKIISKFDNTRSTSVGNIARLVTNEENKNAGNKEVNNYVPIDLGKRNKEIFVTESGGSTTVSGSTGSRTSGSPSGYVQIKTINGQKWGMKADGIIEKVQ